jgi:hypothetical protein
MNHPSREEWMAHLYNEADENTRANLEAHLAVCPDCKKSLTGWRATMGSLDSWTLPTRRRLRWSQPMVVKWAAAAAVILALGFGLGRVSSPGLTLQAAQDQLLPALRQQLQQDLAVAMDVNGTPVTTPFQREMRNSLDRWATAGVGLATAESQRLLGEFASYLKTARAEDHQKFMALFRTLREEMETVAVNTDNGFKTILAAATQPEVLPDADESTLP